MDLIDLTEAAADAERSSSCSLFLDSLDATPLLSTTSWALLLGSQLEVSSVSDTEEVSLRLLALEAARDGPFSSGSPALFADFFDATDLLLSLDSERTSSSTLSLALLPAAQLVVSSVSDSVWSSIFSWTAAAAAAAARDLGSQLEVS